MSYEILYRARVIKTSKGMIPVIEMGSNNCYEHNGKRARDFQSWLTKEHPQGGFLSLDDVLRDIEYIRKVEKERYPEYKDESWGYYTCLTLYGKRDTTYTQFVNYFKLAYKKAKTVEEWAELGVSFQKRVKYGYRGDVSLDDYFVNTEEDLFGVDWKKVYVTSYGDERKPFRGWKWVENKVDKYYVVRAPKGYLVQNTKYGYRYSAYGHQGAKHFPTKSAAQAAARGREGFVVEEINEPHTFNKKEYVDNAVSV